jgi:hypothetical protein
MIFLFFWALLAFMLRKYYMTHHAQLLLLFVHSLVFLPMLPVLQSHIPGSMTLLPPVLMVIN